MKRLLFLVLFVSHSASADSLTDVRYAISSLSALELSQWNYEIENRQGKDSFVERHQASNRGHWQLVSINGNTPKPNQLATYQQKKKSLQQRLQGLDVVKGSGEHFAELINSESLALIGTEDHLQVFSFQPLFRDYDPQTLQGRLVFDTKSDFIKSIEISNSKPISPRFSVSIERLNLKITFQQKSSHVLPQRITMNVKGKSGVFKTLNKYSDNIFRDYQSADSDE